MNDPNFFSGAGEKYNLLYKRLKSAVGIDPEAAVPQEFLRKATAANVFVWPWCAEGSWADSRC